jgi:tetratricopeptide (TPR) repeat protein
MRAAGLLVTMLLLLRAQPAHAQGRDRHAASAHFQQGSALYADGRWSDALAEFQAGYDAYPLRGFLVNIGQCYRKLERLDEAADAWRRFLATRPADSKLRSEVEEALAEVETARAQAADVKKSAEAAAPVPPPAAPTPVAELAPTPPSSDPPTDNLLLRTAAPPEHKKKSRAWVWAVVGVAAASVAAAAVTVGVVEWQATSGPRGGSLGLIDGRR